MFMVTHSLESTKETNGALPPVQRALSLLMDETVRRLVTYPDSNNMEWHKTHSDWKDEAPFPMHAVLAGAMWIPHV
jgi:hypothetical protein